MDRMSGTSKKWFSQWYGCIWGVFCHFKTFPKTYLSDHSEGSSHKFWCWYPRSLVFLPCIATAPTTMFEAILNQEFFIMSKQIHCYPEGDNSNFLTCFCSVWLVKIMFIIPPHINYLQNLLQCFCKPFSRKCLCQHRKPS